MQDKKFKMIDESFICYNCNKEVHPLGYTARDHCPNCLHSLHLDINPGDRASNCKGHLIPIGIEKNKKRGYKILYKCDKCGIETKNVMATDDNMEKIISISVQE
jgi:predicted RNA-binding Zn-ribbon protein involved in translation (DUF1610 family)